MTLEEKINYLNRYRDAKHVQRAMEAELDVLKRDMELVRTVPGTSEATSCVQAAIDGLNVSITECMRVRAEVFEQINASQGGTQKELLIRRHMVGQSWSQIAADMNMDDRWCRRLYKRAVEAIDIKGGQTNGR